MERSQDVEAAFVRLLAALSDGDEAGVSQLATTGDAAALIVSDPREWFTGQGTGAVLPSFARAFSTGGLRITPGDPEGYADGPVGRVVDRPTFRTLAGSQTQTRMSGIFHLEGVARKLVHLHNSEGVPDAQVEVFRALAAASADSSEMP